MLDMIKTHFDKLIIVAIIVCLMGFLLHMLHDAKDDASIAWLEQLVTGLVGSLITLITGQAVKALQNRNGDAAQPVEGSK